MKKIVAVFLVLTLLFVLVGCGKKDEVPTTTTPYVDTGLNNNYNNDYVSESYIDTTYSDSVTVVLNLTLKLDTVLKS